MYVRPAFRRWGVRCALALAIAIAIGYVPGQVARRDPRAAKLEAQIEELTAEARTVAARRALKVSIGAIAGGMACAVVAAGGVDGAAVLARRPSLAMTMIAVAI